MKDFTEYIPVGHGNRKSEIKKILKDIRLKGAKVKIRDMLKEAKPEHKEYLKSRYKSGLDKRYSVNVHNSYYN